MRLELDNVNSRFVTDYGYVYQFTEDGFDSVVSVIRKFVDEGRGLIDEIGYKFYYMTEDSSDINLLTRILEGRNHSYRYHLRDEVHMECCRIIANLSKDFETRVGAKIVAQDGTPVSEGYNGPARYIDDRKIPLRRSMFSEHVDHCKYDYMIHAEQNALNFADRTKLPGSTLYVTHFPCKVCANNIAQNGISRVVVDGDSVVNMTNANEINISKNIFELAGIELTILKKRC